MDGLQQQQASKQWELCSSVQQMQTGARQDSCWAAASPPTRAIIRWAVLCHNTCTGFLLARALLLLVGLVVVLWARQFFGNYFSILFYK